MKNIKFDKAKIQEIEKIIPLMERFYAIDDYPFDKKIARKCLKEFISNKNFGRIWLLKLEKEIIGYIVITFGYSFEYKGRDAFGDEFFIEEKYRSSGYGREAINHVLTELKKEKINAIHLEVEKHNPAKIWYDKLGFEEHDRILMTKFLK